MENILPYLQSIYNQFLLLDISTTESTSFILIPAAEMGDKSQLVCMTLAARHRATPVFIGAIVAFAWVWLKYNVIIST